MVLYIPCRGVLRLKVHDTHLVDFRLERYRDIHTELSRRLNTHVFENNMREVVFCSRYSILGIQSRYQVPRVARERQKTARASRVSSRIVYYLSWSMLDDTCWAGDARE
jgi:hypothetical protein